jgi:hypothetical protein
MKQKTEREIRRDEARELKGQRQAAKRLAPYQSVRGGGVSFVLQGDRSSTTGLQNEAGS